MKDISGHLSSPLFIIFLLMLFQAQELLIALSLIFICSFTGGCGSMYEIFVESEDFRGKRQVQQHRLINQVSQN